MSAESFEELLDASSFGSEQARAISAPVDRFALSTERCEFSDLLKSACAHCRPDTVRAAKPYQPGVWGPWFTARFDSDCDGHFDGACGGQIAQGDPIRADGEGGYLCQSCGTQNP